MSRFYLFIIVFFAANCWSQNLPPFLEKDQPAAPDYSLSENWSALPFRKDYADEVPKYEASINDSAKEVDVFYIYPTLYKNGKTWNADLMDKKLNKKIDRLPVKFQASVFNKVGRIYAPRYRQACIASFFDTTGNGKKALEFAYKDVKRAFEYYLKNYNNGRPIILASHSQGSWHARLLVKDFFDTPEKKKQLVCAYIVGFGVFPDWYNSLTPCVNDSQTNCFLSWSSFKDGFEEDSNSQLIGNFCVNPVSWTTDGGCNTAACGILININKKNGYKNTARLHKNYLWVKTKAPFIRSWKSLHLVDYNLFWKEIRSNVSRRVWFYMKNHRSN